MIAVVPFNYFQLHMRYCVNLCIDKCEKSFVLLWEKTTGKLLPFQQRNRTWWQIVNFKMKRVFFGFHVITHLNDFMKSITSGKTILCLEAYGDIKLISHSFHHAFELKFFAHLKKCWMPIKMTFKALLKCFVNGRINHCKIIDQFTKMRS